MGRLRGQVFKARAYTNGKPARVRSSFTESGSHGSPRHQKWTPKFALEDIRQVLREINQDLKRNKALDSSKIDGLLVVELDGNEQFHSRARCCPRCCEREIEVKDLPRRADKGSGVLSFYHRHVYAHIPGPVLSDFGPGADSPRRRGMRGRAALAQAHPPQLRAALF